MIVKISLANGKFLYLRDLNWNLLSRPPIYFNLEDGDRKLFINSSGIISVEKFRPHPINADEIIFGKITTQDIE